MKIYFLGGYNISLVLREIKSGTSFLGGQSPRKSSLSVKTAKETNFPCLLSLSAFV
jgi:hypothetical protein